MTSLSLLVSGSCDTRESQFNPDLIHSGILLIELSPYLAVLKRDGTNVVTDSSCAATSGHWVSPYDNVATNLASDLDIVSDLNVPSNFKCSFLIEMSL
jgi:hypothetical protein